MAQLKAGSKVGGKKIVDETELSYKPNEYFEFIGDGTVYREINFPGIISGSGANIRFTIIVDKYLKNISNLTLESFRANIRLAAGGYLEPYAPIGHDFLNDSNVNTVELTKITDTLINVMIRFNDAYSVTNNTPIMVGIQTLKIKLT